MRKLSTVLFVIAAIATMLTYGFNFPFNENSSGFTSYVSQSPSPQAMVTESFNGLALPSGWTNTAYTGTYLWTFPSAGTYPTCTPHSGAGMASFQCFSYSAGNEALLITPSFDLTSGQGLVSFWMLRDPGYATTYDSLCIWVNTTPSMTGAVPLGNVWRYAATQSWNFYSYNIPAGFNGATNYIIFKAHSEYGNNMYMDDVSYGAPPPMTFVSSTTTQNTASIAPNSTNNRIIGMQVVTTGDLNPFTVSQFKLTTTGSSNPLTDIRNAKVFYTGNSSTFATASQYGTTVANPNGTFYVTGTQSLFSGINYFWLTYDIPSGATIGNLVDATCDSVTGSGTMGTIQPIPPNPVGARQIAGPMAGNYTIGNGMTYANFNAAITDMNARNVGGAVTFLVKPGIYGTDAGTEIDSTIVVSTGTLSGVSAANTVTFKKKSDEVGDVWVERRGTTGTSDYVIGLLSAKYTTFDSINVRQKDTTTAYNMLDWGYYITNSTVVLGSQYNTIKNCQIYLKGTNANTCGIWQYYTGTTTIATGSNSYNTYANNTIVNGYKGIELYGYGAPSPYNLYDLGNQITGNNITGLGNGGGLTAVYGIYTYYQGDGFKILNNTISTAPNNAYTFYGLYLNYGYNANVDINGNTINAMYNANYACYGIYPYAVGALSSATVKNRVNINNNTINASLGALFTTSAFYGIYPSSCYADTLNIVGNKLVNDTIPGTGTAYMIYPTVWGNNLNISNDTISGIYRAGISTIYPIYAGSPNYNNAIEKIYNNYVNNINCAGADYGIYVSSATTTTVSVYNNTISNLTSSGGALIYGIYSASGINSYVYGNKINNLINTLATGTVYGLYQAAGVNCNYYNNFVSNLKAPTSSSATAVNGIYVAGGTYTGIYNNSIYLADTSSSTTYGSNGIYLGGLYSIDVRNNNIVNISKPGNAAYANKTSGIRLSATANLPYYLGTSNNNNIYTNPGDTGSVIYFDGTNRDFTLQSFKNRVNLRDQSSVSTMPNFVNTAAGDLHINPAVSTLLYNGGLPVTTPVNVNTDIDGSSRSTPYSDIGAQEFAGTMATDVIQPTIQYTTLGTGNNTNRAFNNVKIIDPSGVNSTTNAPRVYYKKSTQANTFNDNTSATDGWKYATGSLSGSVFNFTINYSLIFGGSVAASDTVQYFVTAQDNAGTPNVGINSGAFATVPASVALVAANFPLTGTINRYVITSGSLSNTISVGAAQTYTTLTGVGGLFAAINTGVLTGNVNAVITSDLIEDGTNQLQNWSEQSALANYKITIKPDGTTIRNIYGWVANGLIRLYGVNNVTIDGSFGGSGKYLKFVNRRASNTLYPTVQFTGGCTNDTLKNCIVEGNNTSTTSGVVLIGAAFTTVPQQANNNLVISGNLISNRSDSLTATVPAVGICNYGSAAPLPLNSNNIVINNEVKNFSTYGIYVSATGSGDGWVVKNNSLYYLQDAYTPAYVGVSMYGIYALPGIYGSGYTLDSNYIGGSQTLAGGSFMNIQGLFNGMYVSVGYNSVSTIRGNVLKNIRSLYKTASATTFYGIGGVGGWMNITGNYLGSSDTVQRLQMNGIFRGVQASSSFFAGPATVNCTYNTLNNIWTRPDSTIVTLTATLNRYGIVAGGYLPVNCSNNTVMNLLNWQSPGATAYNVFTMAILPNIYSASTITNNTIYNVGNLVTTAPTGAGRILTYGMQPIGMGDGSVFAGNNISHIYTMTTGGGGDLVMGIYNAASYYGSTVTFKNNQITLLDNAGYYANVMGVIDVSGSYAGGICNWYDNSIVLGGVGGGALYNSYAYYKNTTAGLPLYTNMKNNILYNMRTGGTGNNVATGTYTGTKAAGDKYPMAFDDENNKPVIYNNNPKSSATFTTDNNLLVTSNSNMIGDWYGVLGNMAYWQTNSGGDANSMWDTVASLPASTLFRGYTTSNLNIDTTQFGAGYLYKKGTGIAGITNDYNGYPRNTSGSVNIGSHEFALNGNTLVSLLLPANNSTGTQLPVSLKWSKGLFATGYNLYISTDSTFATTNVNTSLTDTTYSFASPNPLTIYYWKVQPYYSNGKANNWSSVFNFKAIGSPVQITLNYPANNAINLAAAFTFNWFKSTDQTLTKNGTNNTKNPGVLINESNGVKSISNYWFECGTDSTFATTVSSDSTLTDSTKAITGLSLYTKYYWRVRAKNQIGWGNTSAVWNFTTIPPAPGVPVLASPVNGATGIGLLPTISWNTVTYAATYRLQVSTDSNFVTTNLDSTGITGTQISVPAGKLAYNNKYFWRVSATNAAGTSSYSAFWNFRTLTDPLALNQSNYASVITPGFMPSGTATRLPVTYRATISGLIPNKTYRYYNQAALYTDIGTTAPGAGIIVLISPSTGNYTYASTGSLTTAGGYETFVANASGSFTGWFGLLNSGNVRYTAGNYVMPSVVLGDSVGIVLSRYALNDSIKVMAYSASAGANNATGIYGVSLGIPKSFIALYDNAAGTGKPLSMTYVENPGITLASIVPFYTDSVYTRNGRWGTIVPNTLANGVRRVEQRSITDGSIMSFNTDADGIWPSGINTVNPAGGTAPIRLAPNDAPLLNAPVLSVPANGTVDMGLTPTMTWVASATAATYRLQVSLDSLFGTTVYDTTGLTAVTINVPAGKLTTNTRYYWRVNPTNVSGTGLWSTVWNFNTAPNSPNQVVLVSPANNAVTQPVNLTFVWNKAIETITDIKGINKVNPNKTGDSPDAIAKYWMEYGTDSTFATVVARDTAVADTTKSVVGLTENTKYFWRVRAKNQTGWGGYSLVWNLRTLLSAPLAPTLLTPANNSVNLTTTPTLDWNDVATAASYRVQISTVNTFTTTVYDTALLTVSQISVPAGKLTTNTVYYWRVNATNAGGTSNWATVWAFTTAPNVPNVPVLIFPVNNSTGVATAFTFTWRKAIETLVSSKQTNNGNKGNKGDSPDAISKYWIQYGTDSTFATLLASDSTLTDSTKAVTALNTGTKYFWRVKAKNQTGWGNWSLVWNFTTLVPTLTLNLKVYLEGFWNGTTQITDTVNVYLANGTTPYAYVDTAKVVLSGTGTASMNFNRVTTGSYYIVVSHRNHLETWSATAQAFVGGTPLSYDFTTAATQAFGGNMKLVGSVWVLFGGDANRDGSIDANDIGIFITEFGNLGYLRSDFNGDQDVNASDVLIISNNFGLIKIVPGGDPVPPETIRIKKAEFDNALKSGKDIKKIVNENKKVTTDKNKSVNK